VGRGAGVRLCWPLTNPLVLASLTLAQVSDVYKDSMPRDFNSGVFLLTPSKATFEVLVGERQAVADSPWNSDQNLLRDHYRDTVVLLPYKYNMNQASSVYWRSNWDRVWPDRRVIHFTLTKPFLALPTGAQYSEWATQSADMRRVWEDYRDEAQEKLADKALCSPSRLVR
jgi:lipopolysaccharide biosynthesis glycosyltransferase